jgi:hypothetical protein
MSKSGIDIRSGKPQGLVRLKGLGKLNKLIHLIESRTGDHPACSIVPQPLLYCVPHRSTKLRCKTLPTIIRLLPGNYTRLCAFIYGGVLVSAPLQAFVFFFLFA